MDLSDLLGRLVPAFAVVVAIPLLVHGWTRRAGVGPADGLRVRARAALGKNLSVAVVEVDGRRFLVGVAEGGITPITELGTAVSTKEDRHANAPGTGLVARLQHMTVRRPAKDPWRPRVPTS
ncbi:MAG TPA: hypothetical protein ENK55_08765 [Actinobacteria bacterium]|nr:hypothetical protein [Actinomycetota bacterium]